MAMGPETELTQAANDPALLEQRVDGLLRQMTLEEKIGQLALVPAAGGGMPDHLRDALREGRIGSVLNEVHVDRVNELQRIAVEESRLGIPLLVGRDVVHGFKTVFPIPLGQAASWNPDLIALGARVAALEAAAAGINWTFAPMVDIGRDPRWGRVAECLGEDPYLAGVLAAAMVRGFQGDDLTEPGSIAACAKHFAGYGAYESGRDYNTTSIPDTELRNVHLPPFKAAVDAGVASLMTSFSDLNGVPATGNAMLLTDILRGEWHYDGFVVSDWESVRQLAVHGLTPDDRESAYEAANAGCDVEMTSSTYAHHLRSLVAEGRIRLEQLDAMVANVLRAKFRLGLFDDPYTDPAHFPVALNPEHLQAAHTAAIESVVLLRNEHGVLPLSRDGQQTLAVIGPLADDPYEQLGTWIFDGVPEASRTALPAIRNLAGDQATVHHVRGLETTRSRDRSGFAEAVALAERSDTVILFLGEEAILSGEAHCRADIGLPGAQEELIEAVAATGKPIVLVMLAGRPLALERVVGKVQALLYAWHPGTMGGPAIADVLFGVASPSGKLPVTFPRVTGQIPIYYAHKQTGKPATPESFIHIDDIEPRAPQVSVGNTSFHLDVGYTPLYPFGFGLSYASFKYEDIRTSSPVMTLDGAITLSADVTNTGDREGEEVAQLYVRDLVGSVTRPVRELKGFEKIRLGPGERRTVSFALVASDLAFYGRSMRLGAEPGRFHAWIGGSSEADLQTEFVLAAAHTS
jgi:beta-glucosidase